MNELDVVKISSDDGAFDMTIDASEGLDCDYFTFQTAEFRVLIKTIGIGIAPKAYQLGDLLLVTANAAVWTLMPGGRAFQEHDHQFPVLEAVETEFSIIVFDHIGCISLDKRSFEVLWRHHHSVMEDYAIDGITIRMEFDDGSTVALDAATGMGTER